MNPKKVLIITYYWPPSGGAGVQRWVKLTKYLSRLGCQCFVLTVDPSKASYSQIDESLKNDIDDSVRVYTTNSFEIINIFSRIFGKKAVPTAGFTNVNNSSLKQKALNAIRSNFFIPDPRIGWNRYAFKKAVSLINKHKITSVITTSPPHSTQLIGRKLKRKLYIQWIADLRDPWTDIYYYPVLQHSRLSHAINKRKETLVLENADKIITVSEGLKELFEDKGKVSSDKIHIIPNGYDEDDFKDLVKEKNSDEFLIVYTGTMSDVYNPAVFIDILQELNDELSISIMLKIVGSVSTQIADQIKKASFRSTFVDTVPHNEINQFQLDADLLLLVIPETPNAKGILTGKLFEYLATRSPIISIGEKNGDAAEILYKTGLGKAFNREDGAEIKANLQQIIEGKYMTIINDQEIQKFSRRHQAKRVMDLVS